MDAGEKDELDYGRSVQAETYCFNVRTSTDRCFISRGEIRSRYEGNSGQRRPLKLVYDESKMPNDKWKMPLSGQDAGRGQQSQIKGSSKPAVPCRSKISSSGAARLLHLAQPRLTFLRTVRLTIHHADLRTSSFSPIYLHSSCLILRRSPYFLPRRENSLDERYAS